MNTHALLVEGWRFYGHSYSIVNEWQLLELATRRHIRLYMRDLPPLAPWWRAEPRQRSTEEQRVLDALGDAAAEDPVDATLRIGLPISFKRSGAGPLYVFCTADPGFFPRRYSPIGQSLREALAEADPELVTPSRWSKSGLVRAGAAAERVHVVPHGVATEVFGPAADADREAIRQERGWNDKFVFLNVSAMSLNKGIDLLLKAFARVAVRHPEALLMLKGANQVYGSKVWLDKWWKEKLSPEERKACAGRVQYAGAFGRRELMAQLYRGADAYVTPYRSEGFNLPALEAVACGLPVIATQGGPTDEFTIPECCYRIPSRRVREDFHEPEEFSLQAGLDELTQAMFDVMQNGALRQAARRLGPPHVEAAWTWRHAVDRLLQALAMSAGSGRSG